MSSPGVIPAIPPSAQALSPVPWWRHRIFGYEFISINMKMLCESRELITTAGE